MFLNDYSAVGKIVFDPELRATSSGNSVMDIRVAVNNPGKKKQNGQYDQGPTVFIDVTVWGGLAEALSGYSKGTDIFFTGKLVEEKYRNKQGVDVTKIKVNASFACPEKWYEAQGATGYAPEDRKESRSGAQDDSFGDGSVSGVDDIPF